MKGTPAKRSSLFLLELIIAILFFSLTSAVCVQIFVRAHLISRQTQELNTALEKVSGFSEVFSCRGILFPLCCRKMPVSQKMQTVLQNISYFTIKTGSFAVRQTQLMRFRSG